MKEKVVMMTTIFNGMSNSLDEIISRLKKGEVGIFPCDTIYGICSIVQPEQKERIMEIKKRALNKSFISLVNFDYLKKSDLTVPEVLYSVWPAPLTAILADSTGVTYAVRVPKDNNLAPILKEVGAIYSTSVNISSQKALQVFEDIYEEFNGVVDFIVKEEVDVNAKASTILDCTKHPFVVLRQGAFDVSVIL